jgi:hypothetical protein
MSRKGDKKMQVTVFYDKNTGNIYGSTAGAKENIEIGVFDMSDGETLEKVDLKGSKPQVVTKGNQISQSMLLEKLQKKLELNEARLIALDNAVTEFLS